MNLAQLNIGRIVAPLDSPQLAEFVARLETVNGPSRICTWICVAFERRWRWRNIYTNVR
ncbi:MAG: DUF3291 domain-containing protein [Actinomycetota bacterium]